MPDQDDTIETNYIAGNEANSPANRPEPGATKGSLADNPLISTPKDGPAPTAEQPSSPASEADYVTGRQQANATNAAPTSPSEQPNTYGGNFGNGVEPAHHDQDRASNQRADPNRGEFGEQGDLGATHGGYGNQFREFDTAQEHPAAEATEEKYYGDGASRPGPQHNSYQNYDGQDARPVEQGHAVRDTPAARVLTFDDQPTTPASGEGNTRDTRNDVGETGPNAAFQNDNGAPTVGAAYAADYGHTSGVSLPTGTPSHHLDMGPDGHGLGTDPASARGGYDGQQSEATSPGRGSAPAPINSPDAPQTEGYGYGHQRSEQEQPGNPKTGDSRNGFGPGGSQEGDASQGHGSQGGSYDDKNPGGRPDADAQAGAPTAANKPISDTDYGSAPRRNAGRDDEQAAE